MKKTPFLILVILILGATLALGFYYSKTNVKIFVMHSLASDSKENKAKTTFPASNGKIKILFVGDMMFDRWIRQVIENKGADYFFQNIKNQLQSEDLMVGNLEGPITDHTSISVDSEFGSKENYIFTFPPETAKDIFDENIRLVNIGNNHILNFGESGLDETEKYLADAGVKFFGNAGRNDKRFYIANVKGINIAFVNYNQFVKTGEQDALNDLQAVKSMKPDFVIVYTHWGTEFKDKPNEKEQKLAHEFIDNGADLIIGSHPHVVETKEEYKGKTIYYSLGNFIFDQYFDPNTQKGLAVEVQLCSQMKPEFKEYDVEMKTDGRTMID